MSIPAANSNRRTTTTFTMLVALSAATAGLIFGYDVSVVNSALVFIRKEFSLNALATEILASAQFWGCVVGAPLGGWIADRFGRHRALMWSGMLFGAADIGATMSGVFWQLLAVRLIAGVGLGAALVVAPMYIAEIAPAHSRGRLVTANQLGVVSGILVGFICNFALAKATNGDWRILFAVGAVPAFAMCLSLIWTPESPRWLYQRGDRERAMKVLNRIETGPEAERTLRQISISASERKGSYRELVGPALRKPLVLAVMLAIIQQVTGINTVMYYGSILFAENTGASAVQAIGMNILVGIVNLVFTILGLLMIDKLGRRPLLLIATAGMGVCLGVFVVMLHLVPNRPFVLLIPILAYVGSFAFGLGTAVWVCLSELFPGHLRGRAMSIATMMLWISVSCVAATFLSLIKAFGVSGVFLGYSALCFASFVYIMICLPETRNRTLEEIETFWSKG
jgi:SP family arabinose:H+ symporter-like MFS transporter